MGHTGRFGPFSQLTVARHVYDDDRLRHLTATSLCPSRRFATRSTVRCRGGHRSPTVRRTCSEEAPAAVDGDAERSDGPVCDRFFGIGAKPNSGPTTLPPDQQHRADRSGQRKEGERGMRTAGRMLKKKVTVDSLDENNPPHHTYEVVHGRRAFTCGLAHENILEMAPSWFYTPPLGVDGYRCDTERPRRYVSRSPLRVSGGLRSLQIQIV